MALKDAETYCGLAADQHTLVAHGVLAPCTLQVVTAGQAANFDASSSAHHGLGSGTHFEAGGEERVVGTRGQGLASTSAFAGCKGPFPGA